MDCISKNIMEHIKEYFKKCYFDDYSAHIAQNICFKINFNKIKLKQWQFGNYKKPKVDIHCILYNKVDTTTHFMKCQGMPWNVNELHQEMLTFMKRQPHSNDIDKILNLEDIKQLPGTFMSLSLLCCSVVCKKSKQIRSTLNCCCCLFNHMFAFLLH
jgi:hypothetical protein